MVLLFLFVVLSSVQSERGFPFILCALFTKMAVIEVKLGDPEWFS